MIGHMALSETSCRQANNAIERFTQWVNLVLGMDAGPRRASSVECVLCPGGDEMVPLVSLL